MAVSAQDGRVTVEVGDDGVGGAALDGGSGIQGLADRVGALSGSPGRGQPARRRHARDGGDPAGRRADAERAAAARAPRSRSTRSGSRNLRIRLASLGVAGLAGVLVLIWALTGPDLPWIVWPLLGLGLIAALDAWHIHATAPLRGGRRLHHLAGALVILNIFIVGVWAGGGSRRLLLARLGDGGLRDRVSASARCRASACPDSARRRWSRSRSSSGS